MNIWVGELKITNSVMSLRCLWEMLCWLWDSDQRNSLKLLINMRAEAVETAQSSWAHENLLLWERTQVCFPEIMWWPSITCNWNSRGSYASSNLQRYQTCMWFTYIHVDLHSHIQRHYRLETYIPFHEDSRKDRKKMSSKRHGWTSKMTWW